MTADGVIAHHGETWLCVCGQPIKRCPLPINGDPRMCRGYVHEENGLHGCRTRWNGLAEPRDAAVPP